MPALQVRLFGGFDIQFDGEPLAPIPSRIARSLLGYLIVKQERAHPRERLAAVFWPEFPDARGRRRLSHTLWQIQDALSELPTGATYVHATPDTLSFDHEPPSWIDVADFERRVERFRPLPGAPRQLQAADLAELREAVELYRGDLLSEFYDPWILPERERLAHLYLEALGWLVELAKSQGTYEDALVYAKRITSHDPLREDAHREVMRLSTLLGRTSDALRQYERCRSVLMEELGAQPARETRQLHDLVSRYRQNPAVRPVVEDGAEAVPRLVGRDRERATAVDALERALAGVGTAVLIEGEPGVGKTRLGQQIVDDAEWRGFTVLSGDCGVSGASPYRPLVEAIGAELSPVRVEQLRPHVAPVWLREAARAIPQLAGPAAPPAAPAATRHAAGRSEDADRMRDAFVELLRGFSELGPTLLVIEDIHEADVETLAVLQRFVRQLCDHRLVLVLTYRSQEVRERADAWAAVRAIDARAAPRRIVLEPLTAFGVAELVRTRLPRGTPAGLATRLHAETGGNPLFLLETLRDLSAAGRLAGAIEDLPLPTSVRELVTHRVSELSPAERYLLELAGLIARRFELDTLLSAAGDELAGAAAVDAVQQLLDVGLLVDADGLGFRHELLRRAVVDHIAAADRPRLHQGVALALRTAHPERADEIAAHLEAAGDAAGALRYHRIAAHHSLDLHAYPAARVHLERAAELQLATPADLGDRAELLSTLESVLDVLGDRPAQERVIDELATMAGDDPAVASDLARRRATVAGRTDRIDEAAAAAAEALALAPDEVTRAEALTLIGRLSIWRGVVTDEDLAAGRAAVACAPEDVEGRARHTFGELLLSRQRYEEGLRELALARARYAAQGDVRGEADVLGVEARGHMETGDIATAISGYREAIDRCRRIGYRTGEAVHLINLGIALGFAGEVAAALDRNEQARRLFSALGSDRGVAVAETNLSSFLHSLGRDERAARLAERVLAHFQGVDGAAAALACAETLASIAIRAGDLDRARAILDGAMPEAARAEDHWAAAQLSRAAAALALAEGEPRRAVARLDEGLAACDRAGIAQIAVALLAQRGHARLVAGDVAGALADTEAAVAQVGPGVERRSWVHWWHHQALAAAGRQADAQVALEAAVGELDRTLEGLDDADREHARQAVPEHRAMVAALAAQAPRTLQVRMASREAPTGRPLRPEELVEVELTVPRSPTVPGPDERCHLIAALAEQARAQGASPTVEDLARALAVSTSTLRRDLQRLRAAGAAIETRGARAS